MTRDEIGNMAADAGRKLARKLDEVTDTEWRSITIVVDLDGRIIIGSAGLYAETIKDVLLACLDTQSTNPATRLQ